MKKIYILLLAVFMAFGCKDFLDVENKEGISADLFWKTEDDARQAVVACYSALQSHWGSKWTFFEEMYISLAWKSDDILNASTHYGQNIASFTNGADDATSTSFWTANYTGIFYCNQVIENVPNIETMSDALKTQYIAEAKFLRALYHFHLQVAFGNIPLILETPKTAADLLVSQSPAATVWAQIESDLSDAKAGLPASWSGAELGRATSWTASAYLGKVYLFQEKFTEASGEFGPIISGGPYSLLPNYADNFNGAGENGSESVFEIQWSANGANGNDERHPFNFEVTPGALGGWELYFPSDWLMTEMQADLTDASEYSDRVYASVFFDDPNSTMLDVYSGVPVPYADNAPYTNPSFFKKYTGEFDKRYYNGINIHLMRYADVLLMQAEALNEANASNTDAAIALVNQVRQRSNASAIAAGSMNQAQLRTQIRHHERAVELAMEYTIRWFDLWRWANGSSGTETISSVMTAHSKPDASNFVDGKHDIFPIPLSELDKNENLVQHSTWQ